VPSIWNSGECYYYNDGDVDLDTSSTGDDPSLGDPGSSSDGSKLVTFFFRMTVGSSTMVVFGATEVLATEVLNSEP
jgi:hypothetical protein